jgi:hypothetical protein
MAEESWRNPRVAWLGGAMLTTAGVKVVLTTALGQSFAPDLVTSAAVVALGGAVLWAVGTAPRPAGSACGCRTETGGGPPGPANTWAALVVTPAALAGLITLNFLILVAAVLTHAATFAGDPRPTLPSAWAVPLVAVAAPFAAGLVWVAAYHARRPVTGSPDRLRGVMTERFWSVRTLGPVVLALGYAVAVSVLTQPPADNGRTTPGGGDAARPAPTDAGRPAGGGTPGAGLAHEARVLSAASIAWALWGVLSLCELRRFTRRHADPAVGAGLPHYEGVADKPVATMRGATAALPFSQPIVGQ